MSTDWSRDGLNEGSREFTFKEDTKNMTRPLAERTGQLESPSAQGEAKAGRWPGEGLAAITDLCTGITFQAPLGVSERWQQGQRRAADLRSTRRQETRSRVTPRYVVPGN